MEIIRTCTFIGHRKIDINENLKNKLKATILKLINEKNVSIFLFGSRSEFNNLCYDIVSELKKEYSHIKRIYIRAEYDYETGVEYFLNSYEETYFPKTIKGTGKYVYIERNKIMIEKSNYCIFYYIEDYEPHQKRNKVQTKSGTKLALEYAIKKKKEIIIINKDL